MMGTLGSARPDFATEAMGINEGDTYLILCPMSTWKRFQTKEELIAALDKALSDSARHRLRFHAAHGHPYRRNRPQASTHVLDKCEADFDRCDFVRARAYSSGTASFVAHLGRRPFV